APPADRHVPRDPGHPGRRVVVPADPVPPRVRPTERLLREVLGLGMVAGEHIHLGAERAEQCGVERREVRHLGHGGNVSWRVGMDRTSLHAGGPAGLHPTSARTLGIMAPRQLPGRRTMWPVGLLLVVLAGALIAGLRGAAAPVGAPVPPTSIQ